MPESAEGLSLENTPRLLCQALLFGRQTDREARLELLGVAGDELSAVTGLMQRSWPAMPSQPAAEPKKEVVGHWSASQKLLRAAWQPPRDASPEQLRDLSEEHARRAILDQWPELKLGVLDGRSPRQVAGDRPIASVCWRPSWCSSTGRSACRGNSTSTNCAALGLPILEPIDPQQHPVDDLPTVRLERLSVERLSDEDLLAAYYRVTAFAIRPAVRKFAEAIVNRPTLADSEQRIHAYAALVRNEEDLTRALEYVEQGRRAAEAKKESSASWDLMELSLRFAAATAGRRCG